MHGQLINGIEKIETDLQVNERHKPLKVIINLKPRVNNLSQPQVLASIRPPNPPMIPYLQKRTESCCFVFSFAAPVDDCAGTCTLEISIQIVSYLK